MIFITGRSASLAQRHLAVPKTPTDKTLQQRQIEATDRQIDALVYELYGLTEAEIKIVEGEEPTTDFYLGFHRCSPVDLFVS